MRVSRVSGALVAGALATVAFGTVPAHAEGSKTTYISYWATGAESSRWHDGDNDNTSTTVRFQNCTTASSPGTRTSAAVSVWKDVFGPDENKGSKGDICSATKSWGVLAEGDYYFSLDEINGTSGPGTFHLDAKPVTMTW
ncbi:hypothetical protein GCM10010211_01020 [Streptomyces albospinus]|uniref:Secreted protein n=1 Tax=Streptomyces albospinus TaxID=285515 RepID=A0ABQ2ULS8_9ACTN|nr:hypothetical protein [Streptomyces albospinus]GGU41756.1 hypothetical protein GCM10010211_01020 [Streptomyces albospinus]